MSTPPTTDAITSAAHTAETSSANMAKSVASLENMTTIRTTVETIATATISAQKATVTTNFQNGLLPENCALIDEYTMPTIMSQPQAMTAVIRAALLVKHQISKQEHTQKRKITQATSSSLIECIWQCTTAKCNAKYKWTQANGLEIIKPHTTNEIETTTSCNTSPSHARIVQHVPIGISSCPMPHVDVTITSTAASEKQIGHAIAFGQEQKQVLTTNSSQPPLYVCNHLSASVTCSDDAIVTEEDQSQVKSLCILSL